MGLASGYQSLSYGGASSSSVGPLLKPTSPKKDPERARRAADALRNALAGRLDEAEWIYSQMTGSATAYGRQQYQIAWEQLKAQKPELAAAAMGGGYRFSQTSTPDAKPTARELIAGELENLKNSIRRDVATTTGRVLAGGTATLVEDIGGYPTGSVQPMPPVATNQLMYIGLALIVAIALLWAFAKK